MKLVSKLLLIATHLAQALVLAQSDYDFYKAEMDSRKLVYTDPDAALPIIRRTLKQTGKLHDTIYGNTYHLYGLYHSMKGDQDSTIYYIKKSISYLDKHPRARARSMFSIAMAYRKKSDYDTSLKYLEGIAEINKKERNNVGQAMVYGEMASIHNVKLEYDKSIELLLKAMSILRAENNTKQIVAIKQKLANTYVAKENYPFAIDLYKECLVGFKEIGADKNYYLTLINMGEALIQVKKYSAARTALLEGARGLHKFGDKELIGIAYSKVGSLERDEGHQAEAKLHYRTSLSYLLPIKSARSVRIGGEYINLLNTAGDHKEALNVIASIEKLKNFSLANMQDRMVYKNAIANTYEATKNDKKAIEAYQHTISIKDSIANAEKESAVKEIQAAFQTQLQQEKNAALLAGTVLLENKVKAEKKLLFLYLTITFIVLLSCLLLIRSYRLKNRLQAEELRAGEAERELIISQQFFERQLVGQQKGTIEEKQRELIANTLRMANYQDDLRKIIEKCDAGIFSTALDVQKELQYIAYRKDYWRQFETRFNSFHPEFYDYMTNKYRSLTKDDLEFCSLVKLNLSEKDIASLLQISEDTVARKKTMIIAKMKLTGDDEFQRIVSAA